MKEWSHIALNEKKVLFKIFRIFIYIENDNELSNAWAYENRVREN